jgi:hypothetical protein
MTFYFKPINKLEYEIYICQHILVHHNKENKLLYQRSTIFKITLTEPHSM